MALSNDLISQFVKSTKDDKPVQNETTVFGRVVEYNGEKYVQIDGSELLTPIQTTTKVEDGERVTVMIKDHTATVTGNLSSPAPRQEDVDNIGNQISEFEIIIADKVSVKEFDAQTGRIDDLVSDNITINEKLTANEADIDKLTTENLTVKNELNANKASIKELETKKLDVETANINFATIKELEATNANIHNLSVTYGEFEDLVTERLEANDASIKDLDVEKLDAKEAEIKYANIDFANIDMAAIEHLFSESGIIKDLIVSDGHITGELVGVTIKGDLIEADTIKADKLVVKGEDGVYYKLNVNAETVEAEQTEYNSLNGSVIAAKSITATKINVDDLVAFGATIGGFKITNNSIYSGTKASADNTTRGIFLGNDGQIAFGDSNNYIRFIKGSDGKYKLEVSANTVKFGSTGSSVEDYVNDKIDTTVQSLNTYYSSSDSPTTEPIDGWGITPPQWEAGRYIWSKTITVYVNGTQSETQPVCISGIKGSDAISLNIISSNGHMFKNTSVSTTLTVEIIVGDVRITSSKDMYLHFGGNAKLIWQQKKRGELVYSDINETDSRISDNGFVFTLTTNDLKLETVYNCLLDC